MPARHSRTGAAVTLWATAPRTAPRRPFHHRGGCDGARRPGRTADIAETLHASFERMLARYREAESLLPNSRRKRGRSETIAGASGPDHAFAIQSMRTQGHRAASLGRLGAASDDSLQSETQRSRSFRFFRICSSENPSAKNRSVTSPETPGSGRRRGPRRPRRRRFPARLVPARSPAPHVRCAALRPIILR